MENNESIFTFIMKKVKTDFQEMQDKFKQVMDAESKASAIDKITTIVYDKGFYTIFFLFLFTTLLIQYIYRGAELKKKDDLLTVLIARQKATYQILFIGFFLLLHSVLAIVGLFFSNIVDMRYATRVYLFSFLYWLLSLLFDTRVQNKERRYIQKWQKTASYTTLDVLMLGAISIYLLFFILAILSFEFVHKPSFYFINLISHVLIGSFIVKKYKSIIKLAIDNH